MQFSMITVSLFATAAMAVKTVTSYDEITIISCAQTVTNCPADSTSVSTIIPTTTPAGIVYTNSTSSATYSYVTPTTPASSVVVPTSSPAAVVSSSAGPLLSTITISTCVPTVIYSTVTVAPTSAPTPAPTGSGSGSGSTPSNGTISTSPSPTTTPFSGAANVQTSLFVAAAAGLAAFLFA